MTGIGKSTSVDAFQVFDLQNPTKTDKDTTIVVSIKGEQFHHITLFVVTKLITLQQPVCFTSKFRRWKDQLLEMCSKYLIVKIRPKLMEIQ
jgi:hypothetical protein